MKRETNYSIVILIGLFVFLNVFAVVSAQQQGVENPVIIEGNNTISAGVQKIYDKSEGIEAGQSEMVLGPLGRIEPILEQESLTRVMLNVIVYLHEPGLEDVANEAKAPFKAEIDSLSSQLRQMDIQGRPQESLKSEHEKLAVLAQQFMRTEKEWDKIAGLRSELDNKMDEKRRAVGAALKKATQPKLKALEAFITANGGEVTAQVSVVPALGAVIPATLLNTLANHPLVLAVTKDRPTEYELDVSIPSVDYDTWWTAGFDGSAYDFGIVDDGVRDNHPAFAGINFYEKSGSSVGGSHGTHVTGIVASADATYRGGAYGLDAIIWANSGTGSTTEIRQAGTMDNMEWLASGAAQGPEVVNHSLGYGTADDTDYSDNDSFYDAYVSYYDIMVTKSTGNKDWHATEPTITHPAPAYNLLACASMNDRNTLTRTDDIISTHPTWGSSVGPTVNGRKKPDIAAPGDEIMSTYSGWASYDNFIEKSGTSMAAPHVAAAIILMEDGGNHTPMAQKAVLINTADAWTCNNTETTADDGSVTGSHWDKWYGWGALATEENFVRADPPAFSISLTMPPAVVSSTVFTVTANVQNTGDVKSHNNMATLTVPGGFTIVTGANPQNIGIISAGATGQATWTVRASSTSGNYTISASNSSSCYIETYTGSGSGSIIVDPTHTPLSNDTPVIYSAIPKGFSFSLVDYDWCCIGINPSANHNIKADDNSDLLTPYQNSTYTGTTRDFVVTNGHQAAWGAPTIHYAQVHYGTASNYTIEVEWAARDLPVNYGYADTMPSNHVFQMYEIYLTDGQIYELTVDITSGSTDVAVFVFKPTRSHGRRAVYDWMTNSGGAGVDESLIFTADSTGYYGIAVINDNALSANYTITVDKYIQPLSNDTPVTFSGIPKDFSFQVMSYDWCGVGINPSADHHLSVDNNSVLTTPYAFSTFSGTTRDFTVTNGHSWGSVEHYARVYYGAASNYVIEAEWLAVDLSLIIPTLDSIGSGQVIQMYEANLTGGNHYQLSVDVTSGKADLAVYVFRPNRNNGSRLEYDWRANVNGSGVDEYLCFTANLTGYYGIAVINENAGASDYTIAIKRACTRDVFADGISNFKDLALILLRWLEESCTAPDWCGCTDLDQSGKIDNGDVRSVAEDWLTVFKWFDRLTAADIAGMDHTLSRSSIDASGGSEFWPGTYFVYKTNLGRYGKFIVDDLDQADNNKLTITWVTYNSDGSTYSKGSGLEINGTWDCDLDKGVEGPPAGAADWQWVMKSSTVRYLRPVYGAQFKLMYQVVR